MALRLNLKIIQGATFSKVFRWGAPPFIYAPIASISRAAPARIVTTGAHGIPDGWRVAPVSALGMTEINAAHNPPRAREYTRATVINSTTVDLNAINASQFTAYTSGGYLQFYTPVDLSGAILRLNIRDRPGGTLLLGLTSVASAGIALDNTAKTITASISATATAALSWVAGVCELEAEISGVITVIAEGVVMVEKD